MSEAQRRHLAAQRAQLDALDQRLLETLAQRAKLVDALWRWKAAEGLPQTDPSRERDVIERWKRAGEQLGLDGLEVEHLAHAIIGRRLAKP